MPASAYLGALAWCALADVASKTMSGSSSCASSQSTPSALASRPIRAARRSPSDVGSTPTMNRGSTMSLRRFSLYIRSVPMFPDPTMAAVAWFSHRWSFLSSQLPVNRAVTVPSPPKVAVTVSPAATAPSRTPIREDHVPGLEGHTRALRRCWPATPAR
jgi:hypothetical protein